MEKRWCLKTNTVPVIVKVQGMIKKGTDKHIKKIPVGPIQHEIQKKLHFAERFILLGEHYRCDCKISNKSGSEKHKCTLHM